jgi:speckle-type POZ protein
MAQVFNIRPGYELVTVKLKWNVQVPFLQTTDGSDKSLNSIVFSPWGKHLLFGVSCAQETPNSKWKLLLFDQMNTRVRIYVCHYNSTDGAHANFVEPVLVKLSILNNKRNKVFQQMVSSAPTTHCVEFYLSKEDLIKSNSQQSDGSLTFYFKILTHVKIAPVSPVDPSSLAIDCSGGLITHLVNLFDNMQFSDVNFNVSGREFPAHKSILAARSQYFAAMFQHPMKENSTNQVKIEDIDPEVFDQLLRFIYTGRVPLDKLETMAADLFIAADKYLMDELKMKCENYLLSQMSPDNCVILLLHGDLQNPAEYMKKAAKFFRRSPSQVMATDKWKKLKQENLALLCDIHEFVHRHT